MLKVTYAGSHKCWEGVLKDEAGNIVWRCGHSHHNRDTSSKFAGISAKDCAARKKSMNNQKFVESMRKAAW